MLCISVCSHMVHYSFINKGIVEHQPTIVTECIPVPGVLIVKTCHTLQTSETGVNLKKTPQTKYKFCIKPGNKTTVS